MINVSVEYYNNKEKELFQNYPNCSDISSLVNGQQTIPKDELLAYMIFTEQKDHDGFRSYEELKERVSSRLGDIDDYFDFSNNGLSAKFIGNQMDNNLIERFGVGLGLSAIGKLHNLTEADWKRIPEAAGRNGHPTFDYDIPLASDGNKFIQVENKGSAIEDNTYKPSTVSQHYGSIKNKKEYLRGANNSNLYYGTIGVTDNISNHPVKLLLVDPPSYFIDFNPKKYKLLARLHYYLEEFKSIGVKRKIVDALEKRIHEIVESSDYTKFDNKPLDYKYPVAFHLFMEGKMFAAIDYNEAFGKFFIIENNEQIFPFIIAYPKALMRLIVLQRFDDILSYAYDHDFIKEKVNVLLRAGKRDKIDFGILEKIGFRLDERRGRYFEASYYCNVSHSLSGRLFGQLTNFKN
jgi:hypothetical protein